jgi:hypothetical protein
MEKTVETPVRSTSVFQINPPATTSFKLWAATEEPEGRVEEAGRAALVEKEVLGGREPTALVTREVSVLAVKAAPVVQEVKAVQAVMAARAARAVTATTLPSATQSVKGLTTSLPIRGAARVALVVPADSLEPQETAGPVAMVV